MTNSQDEQKNKVEKERVLDTCLSIFLFGVILALVSNICVLVIARHYNDEACKSALSLAARAVVTGHDRLTVERTALLSLRMAPDSILVGRPEPVEFKDYHKDGGRALLLRTRSVAKLPVPFLIPNAPLDGLALSHTYELELKKSIDHAVERD